MSGHFAISRLDFRVLVPVAVMSLASLALAFVPVTRHDKAAQPLQDTLVEDTDTWDETIYYEQVAEEFMAMLPGDKRVVAKMIDSKNHNVIYYETTECPSCYSYDLETQNTSVLFGSGTGTFEEYSGDYYVGFEPQGFYIDTKLMLIGKITDCRRVGDRAVFIATNIEPEVGFEKAVHVFELNLYDLSLKYIATGASAYFSSESQLVVNRAKLLYRSLFTDEDVYTTAPIVYDL